MQRKHRIRRAVAIGAASTVLTGGITLGTGAATAAAPSQTGTVVTVIPDSHDPCKWVKGHWEKNWVKGHWEKKWVHGRWVIKWQDGHWEKKWVKGHWEKKWIKGHWEKEWIKGHLICKK
jgi:hypothetical protein